MELSELLTERQHLHEDLNMKIFAIREEYRLKIAAITVQINLIVKKGVKRRINQAKRGKRFDV